MAVMDFLKSTALPALIAGLATLAMPAAASAQERQHGGWRGGGDGQAGSARGDSSGWRGGGWRGGGQPATSSGGSVSSQPTAPAGGFNRGNPWAGRNWQGNANQQAQPAQQAPSGNWSRRGWRGDSTSTQQAGSPVQQQAPRQADGGWTGRRWRDQGDNSAGRSWRGNPVASPQIQDRQRGWNHREVNRSYRQNNDWRGSSGWNDRGTSRGWNRGWRDDNRYNWSSHRRSHPNVYRLGRYYPPYGGYGYRALGIGFQLDSLFYSSNYWIDDPWSYRLPDVDGPYRWVRYYDDAVLVDIYTGEVVDVIRDFFW